MANNESVRTEMWCRRTSYLIGGILVAYIITYLILTVNGSPIERPINTFNYQWSPYGFRDEKNWSNDTILLTIFYPLYKIDRHCWHTNDVALKEMDKIIDGLHGVPDSE